MSNDAEEPKKKAPRATTASRNRSESPPPYRSTEQTSIEDFANEFWQHAMNVAEHFPDDFKHQALPLARIKKVAKMDPELQNQMISSEVTVLFEKACQIFIQELTARSHMRSLAARRRMISRADVAAAVSRSDMFDFLIDIVPRAERSPSPAPHSHIPDPSNAGAVAGPSYSHNSGSTGADAPTSATGRPMRSTRARRYSERGSDTEGQLGSGAGPSGGETHDGESVGQSAVHGNGADGPPLEKRVRANGEEAASQAAGGGRAPAFATGMPPSGVHVGPANGTSVGAEAAEPARQPQQQQQQQPYAQPILPPGLFMPAIEAGAHQIPWTQPYGYPPGAVEAQQVPAVPSFYTGSLVGGEEQMNAGSEPLDGQPEQR